MFCVTEELIRLYVQSVHDVLKSEMDFYATIRCKIFFFSPLIPSKREKNILVLLILYIFEGSVFTFQFSNNKSHSYVFFWHNCESYHSKIEKSTHFPQKIHKLSKTCIFFSHFERTIWAKKIAPKLQWKCRLYPLNKLLWFKSRL